MLHASADLAFARGVSVTVEQAAEKSEKLAAIRALAQGLLILGYALIDSFFNHSQQCIIFLVDQV
jgi:hypothetical protein